MKQLMCAIWDSAVGSYMRPFMMPSRAAALRVFSDEVNRSAEDNMMFKHPEDYELRILMEWDDESGFCSPLEEGHAVTLVRARDCKRDQA